MIKILDDEVSEKYAKICAPSWARHFNVEYIDAVTPKTYINRLRIEWSHNHSLKFQGQFKQITPIEKSIFYSHIKAWKRCSELNEPIIVCEHDSYLHSPNMLELVLRNIKSKKAYMRFIDRHSMGAYIISPHIANKLIRYISRQKVDAPLFGFLMYYFLNDVKDSNSQGIVSLYCNPANYIELSCQVYEPEIGNTNNEYIGTPPIFLTRDMLKEFQ